jgi:hypothetical protein
VEIEGSPTFTRIMPCNLAQLMDEYADVSPPWFELDRIGDTDKLWILPEPITITVTYRNSMIHQWRFERGFIWDKASVPIFKDNILESIFPAMVHDANFSCHHLKEWQRHDDAGFRATNELFRAMLKERGMNWFRRLYYKVAVSSIVGQALYNKNDRAFWHDKTTKFREM